MANWRDTLGLIQSMSSSSEDKDETVAAAEVVNVVDERALAESMQDVDWQTALQALCSGFVAVHQAVLKQ